MNKIFNSLSQIYNNNTIFKSITQIDDDKIIFYNDEYEKNEIPEIISIYQILKNCKYNHISIISLLKIIFKDDKDIKIDDVSFLQNIEIFSHRIFLPKNNIEKSISII